MRPCQMIPLLVCIVSVALSTGVVHATDVDGAPDCDRIYQEAGDAPEGIVAYPSGVIGRFPTCTVDTPAGTQELFCPAISTLPGLTGRVFHAKTGSTNFWFGCHGLPGAELGLDGEPDGKVNTPSAGVSSCATPGNATDCVEAAFGMSFDQDECYADGSDAALSSPPAFVVCAQATLTLSIYSCEPRNVLLQVLVDWNGDGDWNDNFDCGSGCAYEWAIKNLAVSLASGCNTITTPSFLVGPNAGHGWMRVSITTTSMSDDFPWLGHGDQNSGAQKGGETEDYPVTIDGATPTQDATWGKIKALYH